MAAQTGLYLVVNCHEIAGNLVKVDNVRYTDFTYDDSLLLATTPVVHQDDISFTLDPLDKWQVAWSVVVADIATYKGKSATTLEADSKTAINAAFPGAV